LSQHRRELWVGIAIVALFAALGIVRPEYFGRGNLIDLFLANVAVLIIAAGMTLVMLAGDIDISVGSAFAVCAVSAGALSKTGAPMLLVFGAVCVLGAFLGAEGSASDLTFDALFPNRLRLIDEYERLAAEQGYRTDIDPVVLVDALLGSLFMHLITTRRNPSREFGHEVVAVLLDGIRSDPQV